MLNIGALVAYKGRPAKVVSSTNEDNKKTKQKINEYVREIDKCIALLNK